MMATVLIAASGMAWMVHRARVQRDAVAAIHRAHGYCWYEWRVVSKDGLFVSQGSPRAPKWLLDTIGVDHFGSVIAVSVAPGHRPQYGLVGCIAQLNRLEELTLCSSLLSDREMAQIGGLRRLKKLDLGGCRFTELGISKLSQLDQLSILNLQGASVSDAGVANLVSLKQLQRLDLRDTMITDAGLSRLRDLPNLRVLLISGPRFSDATVVGLHQALPNLTIVAPDRSDLSIYRSVVLHSQSIPTVARLAKPNLPDRGPSPGR